MQRPPSARCAAERGRCVTEYDAARRPGTSGVGVDVEAECAERERVASERQPFEPSDDDREIDYFELFCAQAGWRRRLSSSRDYGGSLPCITGRKPGEQPAPAAASIPQSPNGLPYADEAYLTVPEGDLGMRRTHSDCGADGFSGYGLAGAAGGHVSKAKRIWSSIKSLVDSCEGSPQCLSPPTSPPFEQFGRGGGARERRASPRCSSAPHSRTSSVKRRRRPRLGRISPTVTLDLIGDVRPRPAGAALGRARTERPDDLKLEPVYGAGLDPDDWQRVRHFVITPKGIVNCGDSFRAKAFSASARSLGSLGVGGGSQGSVCSALSHDVQPTPTYKVLIIGATGVGKTTLAQQFLTSECLVEKESLHEFEDCTAVTVLLDGEEVQLQIEEYPNLNEDYSSVPTVDAVLVVFSTIDRISFQHAYDALCAMRRDVKHDVIVLVANKIDLVRIRQVAEPEGKSAAATFDCKYFEVSALMSLRVDELLAGVVNQIRLHRNRRLGGCSPIPDGRKSPMRFINKILKRQAPVSKSCDNLLVL